jgi:hypothetical protein
MCSTPDDRDHSFQSLSCVQKKVEDCHINGVDLPARWSVRELHRMAGSRCVEG